MHSLELSILPESFAVCLLDAADSPPAWAESGELRSVTRTGSGLSIVCREDAVPPGVVSRGGWRAIRVAGPLDFSLTGILASLATPLADAGVSIFALSTHDTDYVLVQEESLGRAVAALAAVGHSFLEHKP